MKFRILLVAICVFALALPALAQGLDGKWEATVTTQRGDQTTTFMFKVAGGNITGTVTAGGGRGGPQEIKNGKLDGMKVSFETSQAGRGGGDPVTITWTGTLAGDSLKLTNAGGRAPQTMEAKRAK
jgi:hypothetical protein